LLWFLVEIYFVDNFFKQMFITICFSNAKYKLRKQKFNFIKVKLTILHFKALLSIHKRLQVAMYVL